MGCYYKYNEAGEEVKVEFEGVRFPEHGRYRLCKDGRWWRLDEGARKEADYINVGEGVKSPIDDKFYTNGYAYADHAKAHNLTLIGNDYASRTQARQERIAEKVERSRR